MRRAIALLAILGIGLAACGGDDEDDTATEDSVEEPTGTTAPTETTDAGDEGDDDLDELAEGLGECGFLAGFASAFAEVDPATAFTSGEAVDFGALFGPLAEAARQVADDAPDEIQDAFETIADGFTTVAEELEGVVLDVSDPENVDPEAMAALEGLDTSFDEEFDAASQEIEAWVADTCPDAADALDLDAFGS